MQPRPLGFPTTPWLAWRHELDPQQEMAKGTTRFDLDIRQILANLQVGIHN